MAAGLGFKEFTTGDVLTAADANGYLASQVVMVFASAAARTSAIASPQEGMISFLKDTNSTEYYSGAAWVAIAGAAAASALVYVGQGTFSAATSATLDNCFTSTYRNYLLYLDYTASAGSEVRVTFRTSGVDNTNANYYSTILYGAGGSAGSSASGGQTSAKIGGGATTNGGLVAATIYAPEATAQSRIESRGHKDVAGNAEVHVYTAGFTGTTSFDGIKLSTPTGNLTGTFRIYGIVNS
jgi:hypothetical protein